LDLHLGLVAAPPAPELVQLGGWSAMAAGNRAVLVPSALFERSSAAERAVPDAGATLIEDVTMWVDTERLEVVVAPGLAEVSGQPGPRCDLAAAPGRYELFALHWGDWQAGPDVSRAWMLCQLVQNAATRGSLEAQVLLERMVAITTVASPLRLARRPLDLGPALVSLTA
jgi:hypothetical protein